MIGVPLGLSAVLGLSAMLGACAPREWSVVSGRTIPVILSWDEEIELGEDAADGLVEAYGGVFASDLGRSYVRGVGERLVPGLEEGLPDLPWEFVLLGSTKANAFSLPGGKVFVTRGLASILRSEAELAGVIGHEMAHVTLRHTNQRLAKRFERQSPVLVPAAVLSILVPKEIIAPVVGSVTPVIEIGGAPFSLRFDRGQEYEADAFGVRYMVRAGYHPRGQHRVLERLLDLGGSGGPAFLSTHPAGRDRIERLDRLVEGEFGGWTPGRGSPDGGWWAERYALFLAVLAIDGRERRGEPVGSVAVADPTSWCLHCAASAGKTRDQLALMNAEIDASLVARSASEATSPE